MRNFLENIMGGGQNQPQQPQNDADAGNGGGIAGALGGFNAGGLGGLLGAGAVGGLLGALLGGKGAKNLAEGALVLGGTAAAGALAWNFYKKWSARKNSGQPQPQGAASSSSQFPASATSGQGHPSSPSTATGLQGQYAGYPPQSAQALPSQEDRTALLLLEAMVFAARADGHIDATEEKRIYNVAGGIMPGADLTPLLQQLMHEPIDPGRIAAKVQEPEEGEDVYRLSCLILDVDHFMERSYLDDLATALNIPAPRKTQLEMEAQRAQEQAG